jgi:hypothetical protein
MCAALVTFAAACTGGADSTTPDPGLGAEPSPATTTSAATHPPAEAVPSPSPSPAEVDLVPGELIGVSDTTLLAHLMALLDVGTADDVAALLTSNIPEAEVSECMGQSGFDYVAGPDPDQQVDGNPHLRLSASEYASTYGFGAAAGVLGLLPAAPSDPNQAYRSSLNDSQRAAYTDALAECSGRTSERSQYSAALSQAVGDFREVITADDRALAAVDAWSDCIAAAGFGFTHPQELETSFYTRANSAQGHDELEALRLEEISAAVANVECEEPYTATFRAVAVDRFPEFKSMLQAARAAVPDGSPQG